MQHFDRGAAFKIVSDLELAADNSKLVHHWLSLWSDNELPARDALKPADVKSLLANLIMFDVVAGESVIVRLAGTNFGFTLGMDLTGKDWIELAPAAHRAGRLRIFSDIVTGAIGRGVRSIEMKAGDARSCEEILLPFRGDVKEGPQLVLCHVDWNPGHDHPKIASREQAWGPALAFETIPLPLSKMA
jgi:hypothetical protein